MNTKNKQDAIARKFGDKEELVKDHLKEVADSTKTLASKLGLSHCGYVMGLVHDLGKYSSNFQEYISAPEASKKDFPIVDHSTYGAQLIWKKLKKINPLSAQILSFCIASHHGLIDCITPTSEEKKSPFQQRMSKSVDSPPITPDEEISTLLQKISWENINSELQTVLKKINSLSQNISNPKGDNIIENFYYGLLTRFLLSSLIDSDHRSAANFCTSSSTKFTQASKPLTFTKLAEIFEENLKLRHKKSVEKSLPINKVRRQLSNSCIKAGPKEKGIYALTAPTGTGKTLATLRFALAHAKKHQDIERVIYILPYTSIIEQNASVARSYLKEASRVVLESHCNVIYEELDNDQDETLPVMGFSSPTWNSPIIFTTMVQFFDALFSRNLTDIRRMHQLTHSILIFDEVQALPCKMIRLFNNAINFLSDIGNSTILLSTATLPPFHNLEERYKGNLKLNENELFNIKKENFDLPSRYTINNLYKSPAYTTEEIVELAFSHLEKSKNILVVVNTKSSATLLFQALEKQKNQSKKDFFLYHLSARMCAAHRQDVLQKIQEKLGTTDPLICVSTPIIEAGIDIDFECVIRYAAGFDSIIQSAGRCNRHGKKEKEGLLIVVNPYPEENLSCLPEIELRKQITIKNFLSTKQAFSSPSDTLHRFYEYYYKDNKTIQSLDYKIGKSDWPVSGHTLLSLLSNNNHCFRSQQSCKDPDFPLVQSFRTAGEIYKFIKENTLDIFVPYSKKGKSLLLQLKDFDNKSDVKQIKQWSRRSQRYMVKVFKNELDKLKDEGIIGIKEEGSFRIYYLLALSAYDKKVGINLNATRKTIL